MRVFALVAGFLGVLVTGVYFMTGAKASGARYDLADRFLPPPAVAPQDLLADESDRLLIRKYMAVPGLSDLEISVLLRAAGRRYMRRKQSFEEAERTVAAGKLDPRAVQDLRQQVESARQLCDVVESMGRVHQMAASAQADFEMEVRLANVPGSKGLAEKYSGYATFTETDLGVLSAEFERTYHRQLPVSANGQGPVHRSMGFDHTGRFDVALNPSAVEGTWIRRYLTARGVPFIAFRSAVRGQATGAHIHIGTPSTRIPKG